MKPAYARHRKDMNEAELVALARKLGAWILPVAMPCDYLGFVRGQWRPIEIKNGAAQFTERQEIFLEDCRRRSAPVLIWREERDVLEALGAK